MAYLTDASDPTGVNLVRRSPFTEVDDVLNTFEPLDRYSSVSKRKQAILGAYNSDRIQLYPTGVRGTRDARYVQMVGNTTRNYMPDGKVTPNYAYDGGEVIRSYEFYYNPEQLTYSYQNTFYPVKSVRSNIVHQRYIRTEPATIKGNGLFVTVGNLSAKAQYKGLRAIMISGKPMKLLNKYLGAFNVVITKLDVNVAQNVDVLPFNIEMVTTFPIKTTQQRPDQQTIEYVVKDGDTPKNITNDINSGGDTNISTSDLKNYINTGEATITDSSGTILSLNEFANIIVDENGIPLATPSGVPYKMGNRTIGVATKVVFNKIPLKAGKTLQTIVTTEEDTWQSIIDGSGNTAEFFAKYNPGVADIIKNNPATKTGDGNIIITAEQPYNE